MSEHKTDVPYGTLDLLILKTLDTMGPMHGYRIARRIEQVAENLLRLNQGSIYPALIRLEEQGWIRTQWGISETKRKVKFYSLTRAGVEATQRRGCELGEGDGAGGPVPGGGVVKLRFAAARLLALFRKRRLDGELEGEILAHLEMAELDAIAAGLSPEEARREARRGFGGIEQMKEDHRDQRSVRWMENLLRDVRYGMAALGAGSRVRRGYHRTAGSRHRRQHGHVQHR